MKKYLSLTVLSYVAIILIWSTTPLAIKWSIVGVDYITGLSIRMFIGSSILILLALILRTKIPLDRNSLKVYLASSLGIFGAMFLVYWGAQGINSGLISVIYGLSPMITSIITSTIFQQEEMTIGKIIGASLGCLGLVIIFYEQIDSQNTMLIPALAVLASVTLHAYSAIWIKSIPGKRSAIQITTGGLVLSLPLFLIIFIFGAQPITTEIPIKTIISILYLGVMGSVVGFISYYYALSKLKASTVSLVLFITPVCALVLGKTFNQEIINNQVIYGTATILLGLIVHQKIYLKLRLNLN